MSKRKFIIKVTINEGTGVEASHCISSPNKPGEFEVVINPSPDGVPSGPDVLAHELGHAVAEMYRTKASWEDPRAVAARGGYTGNQKVVWDMFGPEPEEKRRMVASEKEAWEFAGKMREVDPEAVKMALYSYETGKCPCRRCRGRLKAVLA